MHSHITHGGSKSHEKSKILSWIRTIAPETARTGGEFLITLATEIELTVQLKSLQRSDKNRENSKRCTQEGNSSSSHREAEAEAGAAEEQAVGPGQRTGILNGLTVRAVPSDAVGSHDEPADGAERPEGEQRGGEGDLLDGRPARAPDCAADEVVLVRDGEGVVHVRHAPRGAAPNPNPRW